MTEQSIIPQKMPVGRPKIEKVICVSDFHVPFHDVEVTDKFFHFLKDYQPDEIVLNGNMNDCTSFSRHPKKKEVALKFRTARDERKHWFPIAEKFRNTCPNSKITYVGSDCHEGWLDMWAASSDVLIDDPQYEIPNWFELDRFGIDYAPREYVKNGFIVFGRGRNPYGSERISGTVKHTTHD